jgi:hypothetical protein
MARPNSPEVPLGTGTCDDQPRAPHTVARRGRFVRCGVDQRAGGAMSVAPLFE